MKKLTPLFSSTLMLSISHLICCFLPYLTLAWGMVSIPVYLGILVDMQPYIALVQICLLSYHFYYLYFRKKVAFPRAKIIFWITFVVSIFAFCFPFYQHAKAQKSNQFGKNIIRNIK